MSNYVFGSHMSYQDYLQARNFVNDVTSATRDTGKRTSMEISRQTREVIASNEALQREQMEMVEASTDRTVGALNEGFDRVAYKLDEISGTLNEGFDRISYDLNQISSGISELNSTFHWGFGQMIASLGHMNDALSELIKIAKTPVQTVAFNHFEIARDAFRQGLYQESLEELEKAISGDHTSAGYKLEWRFHQMKGTLQLGFVDCDMSLVDLVKAEESFLIAARYGKTDYPQDAGRAFLSAGWAAYCQGKMKEALTYTEQAMAIHPKLGEAFFQAAKIQMSLGQVDTALPVLSKAIDLDRFYAIKAAGDGDFQPHDERLRSFLEALRKEKYSQSVPKVKAVLDELNSMELAPGAADDNALKRLQAFLLEGANWPLMDMLNVVQNLDTVRRLPIVVRIKVIGPTRDIEETYTEQEIYYENVVKSGGFFKKAVTEKQQKTRMVTKSRIVTQTLPGHEIPLEFCKILAGTFMMGEDNDKIIYGKNERHLVTLTKDFYLGKYLVTQTQWQAIMGNNPSNFKGESLPVEQVSWDDCHVFIQKLNSLSGKQIYRLPTEAEWEYACRAGSTSAYCFGDDEGRLGEYAWYADNSGKTTHPVGQKKPNAWGLYDIHGNVWEWCEDGPSDLLADAVTDPKGGYRGVHAIVRGGWFDDNAARARAEARHHMFTDTKNPAVGFRLARDK